MSLIASFVVIVDQLLNAFGKQTMSTFFEEKPTNIFWIAEISSLTHR